MNTIELNESTLLSTAQALATTFKNKGVEGAGERRCLQALCQHFYSKPYEELQKTLFSGSEVTQGDESLCHSYHSHCRVVILRYTNEISVLTMDGEFVKSFYANTESACDFADIQKKAATMAVLNETSWRTVLLPMALNEDDAQDEANIIELAHTLQIFDFKETLFEQLLGDDIRILIDRSACPCSLDGDMDLHLQEKAEEDDEDTLDTCIWHAEFTDSKGEPREYFFTLKEIAEAKPAALPNRWEVNYEHKGRVEIQVC